MNEFPSIPSTLMTETARMRVFFDASLRAMGWDGMGFTRFRNSLEWAMGKVRFCGFGFNAGVLSFLSFFSFLLSLRAMSEAGTGVAACYTAALLFTLHFFYSTYTTGDGAASSYRSDAGMLGRDGDAEGGGAYG